MRDQLPLCRERLWKRWRELQGLAQADPTQIDALGEQLLAAYSGPERAYHTLDHLEAMFEILEGLDLAEASLPAVRLAVWYHDAVYDSRAANNEERSAELAWQALAALGWSEDVRRETGRLILLTKTHQTTPDDQAGQILLDADLAILGADPERYDEYAAGIRREYAWVNEEAYRAGRAQVLRRFLQRARLFGTDTMYRKGSEERARSNLQRELAHLEG